MSRPVVRSLAGQWVLVAAAWAERNKTDESQDTIPIEKRTCVPLQKVLLFLSWADATSPATDFLTNACFFLSCQQPAGS